jgi:hypothetical protein
VKKEDRYKENEKFKGKILAGEAEGSGIGAKRLRFSQRMAERGQLLGINDVIIIWGGGGDILFGRRPQVR